MYGTDASALDLAGVTASGTFTLSADGDVTDSGNVSVDGLTTLNVTSDNITLDDATNNFASVTTTTQQTSCWLTLTESI